MPRTPLRIAAAGLAIGLTTLAVSPASAADPVATGKATAVELRVAGNPADSGTYTASNDGTKQTTTGNNKPAVAVLGNQSLIGVGTLNQDATTKVRGTRVTSAACAGLAGPGATLVAVGETTCLAPGQALDLDAGSLDLSGLTLVSNSTLLDNLPGPLKDALSDPATLAQLTTPLSAGLQQALTALGDPGLRLRLDAVQAACTAAPGNAVGEADLAGAKLVADVPGQGEVTLANLPVRPGVNTKPVADPSVLSDAILDAVRTDLEDSFTGALALLVPNVADQQVIVANLLKQLGTQLAPLTSQVLDLTLNKQSRPDNSSIEVTALSLQVLPATTPQLGFPALSLDIGKVACSAGRTAVVPPSVDPPSGNVPTTIDAGTSGGADHQGVLTVLGVLALLAGVGAGLRKLVVQRD